MSVKRTRFGKTPKDIEMETGRPPAEVFLEYLGQGLEASEVARKLGLNNQSCIRKTIKEAEYKQQQVVYPGIFKRGRSLKESEALFLTQFGEDLKELLYRKYVLEGWSAYRIAPLFGCTHVTITRYVNEYGFGRDHSSARLKSIENGDVDYSVMSVKTAKTIRKSKSSSQGQDLATELLQGSLEEAVQGGFFGDKEVVIGSNNRSVLNRKEVDIAIVVINPENQTVTKYSIEYNGGPWHPDPIKDAKKSEALRSKGWRHYIIRDKPLSNRHLEVEINKVVQDIVSDSRSGA